MKQPINFLTLMAISIFILAFYTIPSAQVDIDPDRIGIGVSPAAIAGLHVKTDWETIRLDGPFPWMTFYRDTELLGHFLHDGANFYLDNQQSSGGFLFHIQNSLRMQIDSSGNVGIGASGFSNRLYVGGSTTETSPVVYSEVKYSGDSDVRAVHGYSKPADGYGYGGEFIGGYKGVQGSGDGGNSLYPIFGILGTATATSNVICYGLYGIASGSGRNYAVYGLGDIKTTNRLFVGTSYAEEDAASAYSLLVNGKGIIEELKVRNSGNWPDYVFESTYSLPSLSELEKQIQEKGHLPGVPSAEEIQNEGGVNVGEMQTLLLEKIEELTLYAIQADKEKSTLEKEVKVLQEQMKELLKK